jgi:hypothetical protein
MAVEQFNDPDVDLDEDAVQALADADQESFYDKAGEKVTDTLTEAGSGIRSVLESVDPVAKAQNLFEGLGEMPLAMGIVPDDLVSIMEKPESTKFDDMLQKVTGFKTGDLGMGKLGNLLGEKMAGMKDLIMGQLMACLEKLILKGLRKVTFIRDFDMIVGQFLGKYKRLIEDEIEKTIKNLIYRKLQIQQLTEFNKKLTKLIRSICNDYPKDIRDMGNDFTKAKYDVEVKADQLVEEMKKFGETQALGYPARGPDMYINGDGTIKTTQQRLTEAKESLEQLKELGANSPGMEGLTLEEAVAMKSLIDEIATLNKRDTDEQNFAAINC